MKTDISILEDLIQASPKGSEQLLPLLHRLQDRFRCIPKGAVTLIAKHFNLSRAEIHGVVSFYHEFTESPLGVHQIQVCCAEACQAMGARALQQYAEARLGLAMGNTSTDGDISLQSVYCLGNCACGPSVRIDDEIYGRVDAGRFDALLANLPEVGA